jgi:hypothetical protein
LGTDRAVGSSQGVEEAFFEDAVGAFVVGEVATWPLAIVAAGVER